MSETIKDGSGTGYLARVNSDNQIVTRSTTVDQRTHSALDGNYYEPSTGAITLTDANEKGIIVITNNETLDIVLDRVFYSTWESTGGTGGGILRYYKNPTTTGGSAVIPDNSNFASTKVLDATVLKNLTTMTGTEYAHDYLSAGSSNVFIEGQIIIPTGKSFGFSLQAPTGNTSMKVAVSLSMFLFNKGLL